jgi:large-conductance mechanosensitive channel
MYQHDRFIFFGSDDRMGLYVGIIVAWLVTFWILNTIYFIIIAVLNHAKGKREDKKKKVVKEEESTELA